MFETSVTAAHAGSKHQKSRFHKKSLYYPANLIKFVIMGKFKDIWDREKDGNRAEQRSFIRFAIVITAIFVLFLFIKKDNLVRWIQAGFTIGAQERRIEALKEDNARLDGEIHMLSTSRDSLERFARENFGFAEPGDDVYIEE